MNTSPVSASAAPPRAAAKHPIRFASAMLGFALALSACSAPGPSAAPSSSSATSTASASPSSSAPEKPKASASSSASPAPVPSVTMAVPDKDIQARAANYVKYMSVEEKAGSIIVQEFSGTQTKDAAALAKKLHLAGTILMTGNIPHTSAGQVDLNVLTQQVIDLRSANADRPWGTIITVDQEGGTVARLKAPFTQWPTSLALGAAGDAALTKQASQGLASELAKYGFTLNFGTDADVTIGALDPTIGSRSFGENPDAVSAMALASASGSEKAGVIPVLKHFPGHGSVQGDSHLNLPVQYKSEAQLEASDWIPFKKGIEAGAPVIMMGHINVPALDPGVPSSMSPAAYAKLRAMGFKGVITTDALNMGAITETFGEDQAGLQALRSGADLLLMPVDAEKTHASIVAAVKDGSLPQKRLDEAARRVIEMQLLQQALQAKRTEPVEPGKSFDISRNASAKAVTVLTGQCESSLVRSGSVQLISGSDEDKAMFKAAAAKAGLKVGSEGPSVSLFGYGGFPEPADIAVATDGPWNLDQAVAEAKVALYSSNPAAFEALIAVLTGKAKPTGKLPTDVGQYKEGTGCK